MIAITHESRLQQLQAKYRHMFGVSDYANFNSKACIVNGVRYSIASEAGAALGLNEQAIRDACNGRRKIKGFVCRWVMRDCNGRKK